MSQPKKIGLDQKKLRLALKKWHKEKGRGAWQKLGRLTGLDAGGLARIYKGQREASINTWLKLHQHLPAEFPLPTPLETKSLRAATGAHPQNPDPPGHHNEQLQTWWESPPDLKVPASPVLAPVFEPEKQIKWNQKGLPASPAQGQLFLSPPPQSKYAFFLLLSQDQVRLSLYAGDLILIEGGIAPGSGELCLAVWPDTGKWGFYYWHKAESSSFLLPPDPGTPPELIPPNEKQDFFLHKVSFFQRNIKKAHRL